MGKTNLLDAIYIYDDGATAHTYTSYVGGLGTNGGTQYIPAMQGFFVKGDNTETSSTLDIPAGALVHNNQAFRKSGNETPENFIRLQITGNGYTDETVVRFLPDATIEMDNGMDAYKMFTWNENVPQLYTNSTNNTEFSINTLLVIEEGSVIIPLKAAQTSDIYTISATEFNFSDVKVYLRDNFLGDLTELNLNTELIFNFSETDQTNRFELVFTKQATNVIESVERFVNIYPNPNNGNFYLTVSNLNVFGSTAPFSGPVF